MDRGFFSWARPGLIGAGLMLGLGFGQAAQAAGDAAQGEKIFAKCLVCHANKAGINKIGPSLFGVMGRPVATSPGFNYSQAMKDWGAGKKWDAARLDALVTNPRKLVANNKMAFPGLADANDRANLIAYLQSLK
ncbi:MAG: c-type cytochrome [Candidatus Symbiobacter sp.]|nr:c-type cytochrome [Candidatus Symbiobacter sp.]